MTLNPAAPRRQIRNGRVGADVLLSCGIYGASGKPPSVQAWLGEEALRRAERESREGSTADAADRLDLDLAQIETEDRGRYLAQRWRERREAEGHSAAAAHSPGVSSFVVTFDCRICSHISMCSFRYSTTKNITG